MYSCKNHMYDRVIECWYCAYICLISMKTRNDVNGAAELGPLKI